MQASRIQQMFWGGGPRNIAREVQSLSARIFPCGRRAKRAQAARGAVLAVGQAFTTSFSVAITAAGNPQFSPPSRVGLLPISRS